MRKTEWMLAAALPMAFAARGSGEEGGRGAAPGQLSADTTRITTGRHCESSAMLNALRAAGYDFTEAEIIGYGAAPSFVYEAGKFPFIGGRSADMREVFFETTGIAWQSRKPGPRDDMWKEIYEVLGRGLPVMLRVDMRFLPYRYAGKYGSAYMSFGWHWVTLFRVDREAGLAYVTDTDYEGLQCIRLRDLEKARSSTTKIWPPAREYAWVEPAGAASKADRDGMAKRSIRIAAENLQGSSFQSISAGLPELERFPSRLAALDREVPTFLLPPALAYMSNSIERNGTGGAAFRTLYAEWLELEAPRLSDPGLASRVSAAAIAARKAEAAWHGLAARFSEASESVKPMRDKAERSKLLAACAEAAIPVVEAEGGFLAALTAVGGD
jgi:hypothetical protein